MPQKNTLKISAANTYYHVYNRGVDKRKIYNDRKDYQVFTRYLKEALSPPPKKKDLLKIEVSVKGSTFQKLVKPSKNLFGKIDLVAYCLMPNHFHLLIKQVEKGAMESFMRSLSTRYSMYFNKKYEREGTLFQGIYKAAIVDNDRYLLHLSRYIHLNPLKIDKSIDNWYSSYKNFISEENVLWLKPGTVLSFFNQKTIPELVKVNSYKNFVEKYAKKNDSSKVLGELIME